MALAAPDFLGEEQSSEPHHVALGDEVDGDPAGDAAEEGQCGLSGDTRLGKRLLSAGFLDGLFNQLF